MRDICHYFLLRDVQRLPGQEEVGRWSKMPIFVHDQSGKGGQNYVVVVIECHLIQYESS